MARRSALLASLGALALATGCYQQTLKVNVHENGAGTIRIMERIASKESELLLDATSEVERTKQLRAILTDELAAWDGLDAWTDAGVRIEDGAVAFDAKGWFEDVRQVRRDGLDGLVQSFDLRREGETLIFTWSLERRGEAPDSLARCRSLIASLKRLRVDAAVTLPGAIVAPDGYSEPGYYTVRTTLVSGVELDETFRALEKRFEAGAITESELVAAVKAKLARTFTIRCSGGEPPAYLEAFRKEHEAARADYAGSDLAREVEESRKALRADKPEMH